MDHSSQSHSVPHVAICPSPGIGHLTPSLGLASLLSSSSLANNVTLFIIRPCLSTSENDQITNFLTTHPQVNSVDFQLLPEDEELLCGPEEPVLQSLPLDPFVRHYVAASRSSYRLANHISAFFPPFDVVFGDMLLACGLNKSLGELGIPCFTIITTSARFLCFLASLPYTKDFDHLDIFLGDIPPPFLDPNNGFHKLICTNCSCLKYAKGILVNSFHFLEPESIDSLSNGKVVSHLPPIYPIGPLRMVSNKACGYPKWLDEQPKESVVYVSFGSRTPLSKEQIMEVGEGLVMSGVKFLWVVKTTIVDKDDKGEVEEVVGEGFLERTKEQGIVVKGWVSQDDILSHPSLGGFVTHCGWNSIMEASFRGIPLVAWPQHGDQRVNANVVVDSGLGVWESGWGWGGARLVKREEIAKKVKEMMTNVKLRKSATIVGEEARKACEIHQSFKSMLKLR